MAEGEEGPVKKGGGALKKYKWWIVGGVVVIGLLVMVLRKSGSSAATGASADTTAANGAINPATGYLYGSPADNAAQGGGGTVTSVPGPAGPPGPPGPPGTPGKTPTPKPPAKKPPTHTPGPIVRPHSTLYTVKPGDNLTKIAANLHIQGGWQHLYAMNKQTIGANPGLIHPGQRLHV